MNEYLPHTLFYCFKDYPLLSALNGRNMRPETALADELTV